MLFEVKDIDKKIYDEQVSDFLPERLIDIHTHIWLDKFKAGKADPLNRCVTWPLRVALDDSIEDLFETYELMFPGKTVTPLIFSSMLSPDDDIDGGNIYVSECAAEHSLPALIWSRPQWDGNELERRVIKGKFIGVKAYLSLVDPQIPFEQIQIFDYFPHNHLEVLNEHGWIAMLHIPRSGRLKDPVNLAQMLEIEKRYPNIKLIIAHVGRAYCPEDVGKAFKVLAETKKIMFDFSANTNDFVFKRLIRGPGPKRILFGSDMPIGRMRTRRICEKGIYVNLVPKGLYGDVSGDKNMREVEGREAAKLSFFMYEEICAFRRAAEATGLSRGDIEDIFYNNASRIIESARK